MDNYAGESLERIDTTDEKTLWCSVFLTFIEDMNFLVNGKLRILYRSITDVSPDSLSRDKRIAKIDRKMLGLIQSFNNEDVKYAMSLTGIDPDTFLRRLEWQRETTTNISIHHARTFSFEPEDLY
jgi:hypothetical protein